MAISFPGAKLGSATDQPLLRGGRGLLTWFLIGFVTGAVILRWMIYVVVNPEGNQFLAVGAIFPSESTMLAFPLGIGVVCAWLYLTLGRPHWPMVIVAMLPGLLIATFYVRAQHYVWYFDGANQATKQWLMVLIGTSVFLGLATMSRRAIAAWTTSQLWYRRFERPK